MSGYHNPNLNPIRSFVIIEQVDPKKMMAFGRAANGATFRIDLSFPLGDSIVIPKVGEEWLIITLDNTFVLERRSNWQNPILSRDDISPGDKIVYADRLLFNQGGVDINLLQKLNNLEDMIAKHQPSFGVVAREELRPVGSVRYWSGFEWDNYTVSRTAIGEVFLSGLWSVPNPADPLVTILPEGFRPSKRVRLPVLTSNTVSSLEIRPDGEVRVVHPPSRAFWVTLDGARFFAEETPGLEWRSFEEEGLMRGVSKRSGDPLYYEPEFAISDRGAVFTRGILRFSGTIGLNQEYRVLDLPEEAWQDVMGKSIVSASTEFRPGGRLDVITDSSLQTSIRMAWYPADPGSWVSLDPLSFRTDIWMSNASGMPAKNGWGAYGNGFFGPQTRVDRDGVASVMGVIAGGSTGRAFELPSIAYPKRLHLMFGNSGVMSMARLDILPHGPGSAAYGSGDIQVNSYATGGNNGHISLNSVRYLTT